MYGQHENNRNWRIYAGVALLVCGAATALFLASPSLPAQWQPAARMSVLGGFVAAALLLVIAVISGARSKRGSTSQGVSTDAETILVMPGPDDPTLLASGRLLKRGRNRIQKNSTTNSLPSAAEPRMRMEWSVKALQNLDADKFLLLCEAFYREKGIDCEIRAEERSSALLRLTQSDGPAVAQCLVRGAASIDEGALKQLAALRDKEQLGKAFSMTASAFSDEARTFAQEKRITLINGEMLLSMIRRLPTASAQRLLDIARR